MLKNNIFFYRWSNESLVNELFLEFQMNSRNTINFQRLRLTSCKCIMYRYVPITCDFVMKVIHMSNFYAQLKKDKHTFIYQIKHV